MNNRTPPHLFLNNPFTSSTVPTTGRVITRALQSGMTTITQAGSALSGVNSQMPPLVNDKALPRAESTGSTDPYEYIDKLYAIAGMSSYVKAHSTTNTSSYYGSSVYSSTRTMRDSVSEASGSRNPPSLHVVTRHQSSLQDPEFQQSLIEMVTGKHQQQHTVKSENNGLQEAVGGGEEGQCQSTRADENRSPVQQLHQFPGSQEENIMKLRPISPSSTFRTAPSASLLKRVASRGLISRKVSFAESDISNNGSDIRLLTVLMNNNRSPAGEGGHLVPPLSAAPSHSFSLILPHQHQTLHGTVVKRASRSRLETVSCKQCDDNEVHHEQEHAGEDDYSVADEEPNNFNRRAAGHQAELRLRPAGRRDGAHDRRLSTIASMESTPSIRRSVLYASDGSEFEALMAQNLSESDRQQGLANTPNDRQQGLANTPNDPGLAYRSRWRTGTCHDATRPRLSAPDALMDHQQRTATRTVRTAGHEQLNASFENTFMTPPIISYEAPNIVKQNDDVGFLGIESGSSDQQPGRAVSDRKSHNCKYSTKHSFWTKLKHRLTCLVTCSIHGDSTAYIEDTDDDKREGASHITVTRGVNESSCHQDGEDDTALQTHRPLSHHSNHHRDVISITPQQSLAANDGNCCRAVNDRSLSHYKAYSGPVALSCTAHVPPGSCQHHPLYDGGDVDCPEIILAAPVTEKMSYMLPWPVYKTGLTTPLRWLKLPKAGPYPL
ncbi:hypothetical protein CEUSTIGMA_g5697.t1 [Chlamydomonas eustigma]|uniref:Uncharacterized protein n=1 Tax=Chlamydomonas eustigma TaxID=1157962 RepID=A0A250X5A0_9CHLO|nr:hypothetical protein CEUSTIGMA_g5697.t1 [Chlamydomonas eustigma]|eukprot:GAX78255.1 hypothetical protein CEUSTIGMA_g5697.t1 [Chlamydomonas eustigma]